MLPLLGVTYLFLSGSLAHKLSLINSTCFLSFEFTVHYYDTEIQEPGLRGPVTDGLLPSLGKWLLAEAYEYAHMGEKPPDQWWGQSQMVSLKHLKRTTVYRRAFALCGVHRALSSSLSQPTL